MRERGRAAVHRRRPPRGRATSTCSGCRSRPSSATPTCSRRSTSPASRCTPPTADRRDPIVIAGGHAAFNPEPIADFIDAAVDRRRRAGRARDHRHHRRVEGRRACRAAAASCCCAWPAPAASTCPPFYDVSYLPDGRIQRVAPNPTPTGVPWRVSQAHRHGPRRVALPEAAARAARRVGARADVGRDLPRLHARLPVLPGRHDHPPRARAVDHRHRRDGRARPRPRPGSRRSGCCRCRSADHSEIAEITKGLADRYEGTQTGLSLPSTRVDAFNIDLANELTRNGRRSGLTFAPEGGTERIRKVINKMVSEEDLINDRRGGLRRGLAAGEALLHVRPAHRDRRGRPADRRAAPRRSSRPGRAGRRVGATSAARCRSVASCPSRTRRSSGRPARRRGDRRAAGQAARRDPLRPPLRHVDRLPLPRRQARHRRGTALARRPPRRRGHRAGLARRRPLRRLERALLLRPLDAGGRDGARRRAGRRRLVHDARARARPRSSRGTTSTPASTRTGSGRTGRTRSTRPRSTTAAGRRASTAACARRWAPRSRSARPARRCCR